MKSRIRTKIVLGGALLLAVVLGSLAYSHCQIPCGIYDDEGRFKELAEHITTIEKSMKQIKLLSAERKPNMNQVVRWVNNKEHHADELSEVVTYYFMAQRVKLPPEGDTKAQNDYLKKLTLLHRMLVYSMKAKQTTDLDNVEKLRSSLTAFHDVYFTKSG
ncbi:superoxide dismutase [Ni] [Planctomycetota bacterium]